ncbi:hypothetical protein SAMN04487943_102341 [Gracilibacillus orientalis]|uniref:DUF4367 domain-containing protein n=1 Tax=Gracilibacillus orientalis TaxID=334253 RepID=A0A1I4IWQ5_9BACI|nr:hypothetical protein [Gracilibacillus orientalis]SFL58799.1 hypothetical protein SAMN04487943_102341 [Gracilibacillus orientalis]
MSNGALDTRNLEVEQEDINTRYKPVEKEIAEEALPYEMKYPSYFPFENEKTKVVITGWENSEERVVTSIRYPSIEEGAKWQEGSITQAAIPNVNYTIANFDRYYSKYSDTNGYNEIEIKDGITGLFKVNKEINGAELYWFYEEKEYALQLMYFSENNEELKAELIKIANSM